MGRHRRSTQRAGRPVRTGLLGASAAMAVGAVAVASGLIPGGSTFTSGSGSTPSGALRSEGSATLQTQGEQSGEPSRSSSGAAPAHAPSTSPVPKPPAEPSAKPSERSKAPARETTAPRTRPSAAAKPPVRERERTPDRSAERTTPATRTPAPPPSSAPAPPSTPSESGVEAEVLALVNEERAKVGCAPVRFDASLARLAGDFSGDMAARGFFSHTDPDGDTPWDRAEQAGVANLGGENIARGQADAGAVMNSWMNSEGHRANILNCDYKTLGVGVHMGDGGPWWTQNFGF
ncbi:CAP domain-containing protein [Streptomyces sp. NPDC001985]|uniref:CAP domain-containing protein n=1 Tax=Streptomyces sp. NPDC001985 TaxID=3154406 RepID=UPI0033252BBB